MNVMSPQRRDARLDPAVAVAGRIDDEAAVLGRAVQPDGAEGRGLERILQPRRSPGSPPATENRALAGSPAGVIGRRRPPGTAGSRPAPRPRSGPSRYRSGRAPGAGDSSSQAGRRRSVSRCSSRGCAPAIGEARRSRRGLELGSAGRTSRASARSGQQTARSRGQRGESSAGRGNDRTQSPPSDGVAASDCRDDSPDPERVILRTDGRKTFGESSAP